jgi:hypothetical protein
MLSAVTRWRWARPDRAAWSAVEVASAIMERVAQGSSRTRSTSGVRGRALASECGVRRSVARWCCPCSSLIGTCPPGGDRRCGIHGAAGPQGARVTGGTSGDLAVSRADRGG